MDHTHHQTDSFRSINHCPVPNLPDHTTSPYPGHIQVQASDPGNFAPSIVLS